MELLLRNISTCASHTCTRQPHIHAPLPEHNLQQCMRSQIAKVNGSVHCSRTGTPRRTPITRTHMGDANAEAAALHRMQHKMRRGGARSSTAASLLAVFCCFTDAAAAAARMAKETNKGEL